MNVEPCIGACLDPAAVLEMGQVDVLFGIHFWSFAHGRCNGCRPGGEESDEAGKADGCITRDDDDKGRPVNFLQ